jgi:hypothetical protein
LGLAIGLFTWWTISISWNIVFLVVVGLYLYLSSKERRRGGKLGENEQGAGKPLEAGAKIPMRTMAGSIAKDFIFVWFLLGLLAFYIFSVRLGTGALSQTVFALGNIVVEILLVAYLIKNKEKIRGGRKEVSVKDR